MRTGNVKLGFIPGYADDKRPRTELRHHFAVGHHCYVSEVDSQRSQEQGSSSDGQHTSGSARSRHATLVLGRDLYYTIYLESVHIFALLCVNSMIIRRYHCLL